jgi:hypothetical protein
MPGIGSVGSPGNDIDGRSRSTFGHGIGIEKLSDGMPGIGSVGSPGNDIDGRSRSTFGHGIGIEKLSDGMPGIGSVGKPGRLSEGKSHIIVLDFRFRKFRPTMPHASAAKTLLDPAAAMPAGPTQTEFTPGAAVAPKMIRSPSH